MLVAGQDDDVADLAVADRLQQPGPRDAVAGPGVGIDVAAAARLAVQIHHHDLLSDHVPRRLRAGQALVQPLLLRLADHLGLGRVDLGARGRVLVATRLVGAELAGVQQVQVQQLTIGGAAIDLDRRPGREARSAQRHGLVIGLSGGLAAQVEELRIRAVLIGVADPVVVGLVVVPDGEPGRGGVGGLQVGVHLVLGVAAAVIVQRVDLAAEVLADVLDRAVRAVRGAVAAAFVDVVAVAEDEVWIVLGQATIGRVVAALVVLAAGDGEADAVQGGAQGRRGASPAGDAALLASREAVPVVAVRLQAPDLDVDGVAQFRRGHRRTLGDDVAHAGLVGDFPVDRDRSHRHAVADLERLGRQAGPDHEAVRRRIARGDAQLERIGPEDRLGQGLAALQRDRQRGDGGGAENVEQAAAAEGVAVENGHGGTPGRKPRR